MLRRMKLRVNLRTWGGLPKLVASVLVAAAGVSCAAAPPVGVTPSQAAVDAPRARPAGPPMEGMVLIPAGTFQMGSSEGEADEKPVHPVRVAEFWMDRTEVTVAAYAACVSQGRCTPPGTGEACNWGVSGREQHPVNCVDWAQASAYCAAVGKRLPTEEEWEYASRAGTTGEGDGEPDAVGWYDGNSGGETHPVGQKRANAWGLSDTVGNVWEWTSSAYTTDYRSAPKDDYRVFRGGSWDISSYYVRATHRHRDDPSFRANDLGFRAAKSLP